MNDEVDPHTMLKNCLQDIHNKWHIRITQIDPDWRCAVTFGDDNRYVLGNCTFKGDV